jgi:phage shock protein E
MKRIPVFFIFIAAIISAACANGTSDTPAAAEPDYTSYDGLSALMKEKEQGVDFFLVDVRTPGEYETGHIPTALLIPVDTIADNLPTEDKDALIIVYCKSGSRAGSALNTLKGLGYSNVYNFGGVGNWKGPLAEGSDP